MSVLANIKSFAKAEIALLAKHLKNPTAEDKAVEAALLSLVTIYASQGAAGFTAAAIVDILGKLAVTIPEVGVAATVLEVGKQIENAVEGK